MLNSPSPYVYLTSVPVGGSKKKIARSPQPSKESRQVNMPASSKSKTFRNKSRQLVIPLPDVVFKPKVDTPEATTPDCDHISTPVLKSPIAKQLEVKQLPFVGSPVILSPESVKLKRAATYFDFYSSYRNTNFENEVSRLKSLGNSFKQINNLEELKLAANVVPNLDEVPEPESIKNDLSLNIPDSAIEFESSKTLLPLKESPTKTCEEVQELKDETLILNVIGTDSINLPEVQKASTSLNSVGFTPSPSPNLAASVECFNIWNNHPGKMKSETLNSPGNSNKLPPSPVATSYPKLVEKKGTVSSKLIDAPLRRQAK